MIKEKTELRPELIDWRKQLDSSEKARKDRLITDKVLSDKGFQSADLILLYVSTQIEVDTKEIMQYCFDNGKEVAVPKSGELYIDFYRIKSVGELYKGRFGIMESSGDSGHVVNFNGSICIVPGLAFDKYGYRIGYGKGYYDRFLRNYDGVAVGLCYKENIIDIPLGEYDLPVKRVITD